MTHYGDSMHKRMRKGDRLNMVLKRYGSRANGITRSSRITIQNDRRIKV